jgi:hypothetical protein
MKSFIQWTDEMLEQVALQYDLRADFQRNNKNAIYAARKRGNDFVDRICSHMKSKPILWTDEMLRVAALPYKKRMDFRKNEIKAYSTAKKKGSHFMDSICSHMGPRWLSHIIDEPINENINACLAIDIMSREDATGLGFTEYYTGVPCNLGMFAVRSTKTMDCLCEVHKKLYSDNHRKGYLENREDRLAKQKKYELDNPEKVKSIKVICYQKNKEHYKNKAASWAEKNIDRRREIASAYASRNPEKLNAQARMRQTKKKMAMPKWITKDDIDAIKEIYAEAHRLTKETGIKMHVDHIIPICGKYVSGLHVPDNLQIIPATENSRKGNKHVEAA